MPACLTVSTPRTWPIDCGRVPRQPQVAERVWMGVEGGRKSRERRRSVSVWFCNSPRCSCCNVCNAASLALRSCNQVVQPLHIVETEVDPRKDEGLVGTVGHLDGTPTQHHSRCYGLQTDFASEHVNLGSDSCGHHKEKWNLTSTDLRGVCVLWRCQWAGQGSQLARQRGCQQDRSIARSIDR
jgi:hypothetical protein